MATKAISELTSAPAVSTTDLFETSCENQSSSSGYSSHKQSLGDISDAIGEDFTHNSLNTTSKNLVGAINEVANDKNLSDTYDPTATYAVGDYCIYNTTLYKCVTAVETAENFDSNKWERCLITNELGQGGGSGGDPITELTGRLAAGETEITLTDSHIETDGTYDFYTSKYGVVPTDVEIAAGSVTLTFDAQSENITVMVRKWGESGGISGGGSTIEVVQQNNVSIKDETEITLNLTKKYKDPYVFPTNVQPMQTWSSSGLVIVDETTGVAYDSTNNTLSFKVFCNNGETSRTYNISWVIVDLVGGGSGGGSSSWDYSTTETDTGQKWIDGKEIYCKVLDFSDSPVALLANNQRDFPNALAANERIVDGHVIYGSDIFKGMCPAFMTTDNQGTLGVNSYHGVNAYQIIVKYIKL